MRISFPATLDLLEKLDKLIGFQEETDIRLGLERLWEPLEEYIRSILPLDAVAFFILEGESKEFQLKKWHGELEKEEVVEELDYLIESGILAWILKRRQPSMVPPYKFTDKSLVILPFVTLKNTYGMAMLISPTKWEEITYEIMTLFSFLSRQVALLLENIEVYNQLAREHQALQDAQERIMFAEKMASVGRLASRASHEILNPLNVILGNAQLIAAKDKGGSPYSKYAQRIIEQGLRIEAIVKSLVKAYDLGNVPKRPVSVSGLLGRVLRVVKGEAEKANVEIEMDVPHNELFIWGSEIALLEAFVSLIKNSFEAMPGGGKIFVSLTPNEESETVIITLRDTGQGIPEDVSNKLFEPFFTTKNGKLGMGLFMVYNVLEEHGGKIEITSEPGQGTKITIMLPLFREER